MIFSAAPFPLSPVGFRGVNTSEVTVGSNSRGPRLDSGADQPIRLAAEW